MEQEQVYKRPGFLTVLCILSFITLGFSSLSFLLSLFSAAPTGPEIEKMVSTYIQQANDMRAQNLIGFAELMEKMAEMTRQLMENYDLQKLYTGIILFLGVFGVWNMWQGRKRGFHFYVSYSIMSVALYYMLCDAAVVPIFIPIVSGIISLIFIVLYSMNLKHMK